MVPPRAIIQYDELPAHAGAPVFPFAINPHVVFATVPVVPVIIAMGTSIVANIFS
ncbi:hypothetical protein KCP69_02490 [Salmonella enterica subsp. enterica]|nr:hypothetical protein KCP69_02490 [Salmonella enterica subsp. enterica]